VRHGPYARLPTRLLARESALHATPVLGCPALRIQCQRTLPLPLAASRAAPDLAQTRARAMVLVASCSPNNIQFARRTALMVATGVNSDSTLSRVAICWLTS
jgi:hypothetical protein